MRALLITLVLVLCGTLLSPTPAAAAVGPGTAGIGDPYFPLDGNGGIDVLHYRIDDRYDFDTGLLRGRTRITLRATRDLTSFQLDLLLGVRAVRVDGVAVRWSKPRPHELRIVPGTVLRRGTTHQVVVRYRGRPGRLSYLGERHWQADRREVVTVGQPHIAAYWFPANDHPGDKARFDIRVDVPRSKEVISGGRHVRTVAGRPGRKVVHWRMARPMATYLAFFAAGDFEVRRGSLDGRRWIVAASEQLPSAERRLSLRRLQRGARILQWLERMVGEPYPYGTTGGLVTALPVGYALENQTRPIYGWAPDPGLMVHELAHQWFGDSVTIRRWRDIWLNEGIATWYEWLWAERRQGRPADDRMRDLYRSMTERDFALRIGDPCRDTRPAACVRRLFADDVYVRGAMTVQALRNRIGRRALRQVLRRWVREHQHRTAGTPAFHRLAEEVTGKDLDGFFDAWLLSGTRPPNTAEYGLGG